ncbi:MAG TPA: membrane dipeptidase [Candidatus Limnocylindria bacterium]|nr:membrane dipeptidase [Candidatus Limnocylindria bacterium]
MSPAAQHPFLTRELTADEEARARELHERAIVIDTLGALQPTEEYISSVEAGGVDAIGLTLVAERHNFRDAIDWIVWWNRELRHWEKRLVLATSDDDIRQAKDDGRIAVIYLFQSGKPFEDEVGHVELFRQLGVTSSQITYNMRNFLGDGHVEPGNAGLSLLGQQVVAEMNRVGMMVDLSHVGERTSQDAIRASARPVYYSHGGAQSVFQTDRFASDETLALLRENRGNISATGLYHTNDAAVEPVLRSVIDHAMYCIDFLGEDHVSLSTDFLKAPDWVYRNAFVDAAGYLNLEYPGKLLRQRYNWTAKDKFQGYPWFIYPLGIRTYDEYPNLTRELVIRGLTDEQILKIHGENFLRLYGEVVG